MYSFSFSFDCVQIRVADSQSRAPGWAHAPASARSHGVIHDPVVQARAPEQI
jgi:hypothetical protein